MTLNIVASDEEIVAQQADRIERLSSDIYDSLAAILPPPETFQGQIYDSLRLIVASAVDFSMEMRTQPCEYTMKWPILSELEANREILTPILPTAIPVNQCSIVYSLDDKLSAQDAVSHMILFPLVVRKGDEAGYGEEESVIFPAQVIAMKGY